jgi:hypothetical protein
MMNVEPETLRQLDLTLEVAEAASITPPDYARIESIITTQADLIAVMTSAAAMLGRMIRDEAAQEGITNGEVWANVRRALLLAAGG